MRWIALDLALALLSLAVLAGVGLSLWRRVTALSRQVATAGEAVGAAMADLDALGGGRTAGPAPGGLGGVRSDPST